jgi:hypothetical protein
VVVVVVVVLLLAAAPCLDMGLKLACQTLVTTPACQEALRWVF